MSQTITTTATDITKPRPEKVIGKLGDGAVKLLTAPSLVIYWATKTGAPAVAGAMGTYLFLVCVESYYRAIPTAGAIAGASLD